MSYTLKIFLKVVHVISKVYNKMALIVNLFGVKGEFSIRVWFIIIHIIQKVSKHYLLNIQLMNSGIVYIKMKILV